MSIQYTSDEEVVQLRRARYDTRSLIDNLQNQIRDLQWEYHSAAYPCDLDPLSCWHAQRAPNARRYRA